MFDIGFSELLIIAVVALLVLGPERLPKAARFAGLWVRRARAQWYSVKAEFEREMAQEELVKQIREPFAEAMAETGAQMRALDAQLQAPLAAIAATASSLDAHPVPAAAAELELTPSVAPDAVPEAAPAALPDAAPATQPHAALDVTADGSAALLPGVAAASQSADSPQVDWLVPTQGELLCDGDSAGGGATQPR
ncbi:hypothetical protein BH11PSE14_BH11PSE14_07110 [soil metagenome]